MAAFLGVDRNTCQRMLAAISPAGSGCDAFVRMPGTRSLHELLARAKAKGAPRDVVAGLTAAVARLESVLEKSGESQSKYKTRVEVSLDATSASAGRSHDDTRRSMFEQSARLLGRRAQTISIITAVQVHPDDPTKVEQAWMRSLIGARARSDGAPIVLGMSSTDQQVGAADTATFEPLVRRGSGGVNPSGLVSAFSSSPAPVETRRGPSGALVIVLDPTSSEHEVDVSVGGRISHVTHPTLKAPEVFHTSMVMLTPCTRLVFDVYLHRALALASVPAVGAFQYTMSMSDDPEENWPFRLPERHSLQLLGSDRAQAASDAWPRHADATEHLFQQTGWAREDFVGHRLDVAHPLWGAMFCQWFDFRGRPSATND